MRAAGQNGDYSIQLPEDRAGDGDAASALDISYDQARMRLVTGRLLASAKDDNDPRLNVCREFYGTLDNKNVTGWDTHYGRPETSDDSHLWHVHVSFLRRYANDDDAMNAVLSVILGEPYEGDDVSAKDVWTYDPNQKDQGGVDNIPGRDDSDTNLTVQPAYALSRAWAESRDSAALARDISAEQAKAKAREEQILAALTAVQTGLNGLTNSLAKQLAPQLVAALRASVADGLDDAQVEAVVEKAVRDVFGSLGEAPKP